MRCISRARSVALIGVTTVSLFAGGCIGIKGATPVTEYELKNNLFPYLREYFIYFRADYTDGEIRRKKSWRNITTG